MVSTSGAQLLPKEAIMELRRCLLPIATVLTPNVPEARLLLSDAGNNLVDLECVEDLISLAKAVQALGPKYVLVKGGHTPFNKDRRIAITDDEKMLMVDVLYGEGEAVCIETKYQASKNTHGTGCSLACKLSMTCKLM